MGNWLTARFDGSHHLHDCRGGNDCGCSARMSSYWSAAYERERKKTPVDGNAAVPMAQLVWPESDGSGI